MGDNKNESAQYNFVNAGVRLIVKLLLINGYGLHKFRRLKSMPKMATTATSLSGGGKVPNVCGVT